ncbi:MAG: ATP-binding protein [Candidatus Binatia bacterium]
MRRPPKCDPNWDRFVYVTREEAATRNRGLLAVGAVLVVVFTLFDVGLDPIRWPVLWTRVVVNATILGALGGIALALGFPWVRQRIFAVLFLLCALVLAMQGYSLGAVSPAPGRLAFHYLSILGLTLVAIQWFWPWQLALGAITLILFVSTISRADADFVFFTVALAGATLLTAAVARVLTKWRFAQFMTAAELRRANEEKTQQAAQLEARNAELRDLFYILSHDLRAPLINLAGFSRELEATIATLDGCALQQATDNGDRVGAVPSPRSREQLKQDVGESLSFIRRNVTKMEDLINGLLELSRIENRPVQLQHVDLARMVQDIVGAFHFQISERRIDVRVSALPVVIGDPVRLNQVFSNLIENAIQYMKPEGPARIDVQCETQAEHHLFRIRDTGIGVGVEHRDKIFRLFTRLGHHGASGEGLGLTVVKKIIEKHGGSIWVESEVGQGCTFCFTLPCRAPRSAGDPVDLSARPPGSDAESDFIAGGQRLAV